MKKSTLLLFSIVSMLMVFIIPSSFKASADACGLEGKGNGAYEAKKMSVENLPKKQVPVVLIHGYNDTLESWLDSEFVQELEAKGIPYITVDYGNCSRNDITSTEVQNLIKEAIEYSKKTYGIDYVDIVAHNMGGLATRWFLLQNQEYNDNVRKVIMVGTQNHGARVPYLTRLATIIAKPELYAEEDGHKKYTSIYTQYLKEVEKSLRPVSYSTWLEQKGYFSGLKNLQYVAAGTIDKFYNGEVGSEVLEGDVRHRFSQANLHYGLLISGTKIDSVSSIKDTLEIELNDTKEWGLGAPNSKYNGIGPYMIVMDRLNLKNFSVAGKENQYKYVANLWLENMEIEEKRMREAYFNAQKHIPTYYTVSSRVKDVLSLEKYKIWDNTFSQMMNYTTFNKMDHVKNEAPKWLNISIPQLYLAKSVLEFAEVGRSKKKVSEESDIVVPPSSVVQSNQYLFDRGEHYNAKDVNHIEQMNHPKMYLHFLENSVANNDLNYEVSLAKIFEAKRTYVHENSYFILQSENVENNDQFQVNIYAKKNANIFFFKRDQHLMYKTYNKLKYTTITGDLKYPYQATLFLQKEEDISDYLFFSSAGQSGIGSDFKIEIIPSSSEAFNQNANIDTQSIVADYKIELQKDSISEYKGERSFDFTVKHNSGLYTNEFTNPEDFVLHTNLTRNSNFSISVKEKENNIDTDIVLALDYSSSMSGNPIEISKATAYKFINTLSKEQIKVIGFHQSVFSIHEFSQNYNEAGRSLFHHDLGGDTSLFDAIYEGAVSFSEDVENRVLLVMTDGEDTASKKSVDEVIKAVLDHNVMLNIVFVNEWKRQNINEKIQDILVATNGNLYEESSFMA